MRHTTGARRHGRALVAIIATTTALACGGPENDTPDAQALFLVDPTGFVAGDPESPVANFLAAVQGTGITVDTFSTLAGAADLSARLAGKYILFLPSYPTLAATMTNGEAQAIWTWIDGGGVVIAAGGSEIEVLASVYNREYVRADSFKTGETFPKDQAWADAPASLGALEMVTQIRDAAGAAAATNGLHSSSAPVLSSLYAPPAGSMGYPVTQIIDGTMAGKSMYLGWDWHKTGLGVKAWNDLLAVMVSKVLEDHADTP